jgi:hypothetical protein
LTADFHDEQTTVLAPDPDRCGRSHIGRRAPLKQQKDIAQFCIRAPWLIGGASFRPPDELLEAGVLCDAAIAKLHGYA